MSICAPNCVRMRINRALWTRQKLIFKLVEIKFSRTGFSNNIQSIFQIESLIKLLHAADGNCASNFIPSINPSLISSFHWWISWNQFYMVLFFLSFTLLAVECNHFDLGIAFRYRTTMEIVIAIEHNRMTGCSIFVWSAIGYVIDRYALKLYLKSKTENEHRKWSF